MWGLNNQTPYAAERTWVRDKTGHHHWVVSVKGTFVIAPNGDLQRADEQMPPVMVPEHFGEPGASSLRFDCDLVLGKATTEIVVNACAYASHGKPATSVPVGLRVGSIQKTLVVYGPRVYYRGAGGLTMTAPQPFDRCPIRYEDAYGGSDLSDPDPRRQRVDFRNPVGKGIKARAADLFNTPAHRIEYPRATLAGWAPLALVLSPATGRRGASLLGRMTRRG